MMNRIHRILSLLLILSLSLIVTLHVAAQDIKGGNPEDYDNGTLSFTYPGSWTVNEYDSDDLAILYSEGSAENLSDLAFDRDSNSYLVRVNSGNFYNVLGDEAGVVGYEYRAWADYWTISYDVLETSSIEQSIERGEIDGKPYAIMSTYHESHDGVQTVAVWIAVEVNRGEYVVLAGFADDSDLETLQSVMMDIAASADLH